MRFGAALLFLISLLAPPVDAQYGHSWFTITGGAGAGTRHIYTKALFGPESALGSVPMPIAEHVHAVLFEGKDPRTVVTDLMTREPAAEMDGLAQRPG